MLELLQKQREALFHSIVKKRVLTPLTQYDHAGSRRDQEFGQQRIAQGKVGCIILAGGQGTRLECSGPKGAVPISLIQKKSLFQLFFERTLAASKRAERELPLAVMTSPLNHQATEEFLEKHHYFGLGSVDLFAQPMLPFLDLEGNWVYDASGKILEGPDGNGGVFKSFYRAGLLDKWSAQGVESIAIVLIDNPLADPFDSELCGYHGRKEAEITLKCIPYENPEEKVGVVALDRGKPCVVEYLELSEIERHTGRVSLANTSLFCFDMAFIRKTLTIELPWHVQKKQGLWKFETFIFDLLSFAERIAILCYPREDVFAPLKNASHLKLVQEALLRHDQEVYFRVTGIYPPRNKKFELDPVFYYPTLSLIERWHRKPLPDQPYITDTL